MFKARPVQLIGTLLAAVLLIIAACAGQRATRPSTITPTALLTELKQPVPAPEPWTVYDTDPEHPWNQLHRVLFGRVDSTGRVFGREALDPYLWRSSTHLRSGSSLEDALRVLDEFLTAPRDGPWRDPLRRAVMQRDLWAVFDQATMGGEATPLPELEHRLVRAIRTLALSKNEILDLPDSLERAIASGRFPTTFAQDHPTTTYLPLELLNPAGAWICLGRRDGPAAISHVAAFPFYGRSVFLPCLRAPAGREATAEFLAALQENPRSANVPEGSEVALIRRALLIDENGEIVP